MCLLTRRIGEVLGLSRTELAALFGLRRQAVDQWAMRGVPAARQEKLATIGAIGDDDQNLVLAELRDAFDWSTSA